MMKERVDVGGPLKPSGTRKFCADIDVLRREELKRRRLLRLEQVRQQSKDIACDIRNKVRLEKNCLTRNIQERAEVAVSQWKEQKLTALQSELTETLSHVGSAHKQAQFKSKQEEAKEQQKNLHVEAADRRGREAILRLRSDELARKQAEEVKKLQQLRVRSVEEARTAVLVSLPAPKSTVPVGIVPRVPKLEVIRKEKPAESNKKQWPSKPWPVSIPLGVTPANEDDIEVIRTNNCTKPGATGESNDAPSVCPVTQPSDKISGSQEGDAPSKACSSKLSSRESRRTATASKSSQDSREVELYDYSNGSHVQYVKPSAVSKSISAGPIDGVEAAEACSSNLKMKQEASLTHSAKRIQRGKEAIKRVKTRREHQALLSELAGLVRQQATLQSFLPEPQEPKKLEKKLNEAVVELLKEAPERGVGKSSLEAAKVALTVPPVDTSDVADETIINVCSLDETVHSKNLRSLSKEDRERGEEKFGATETGGDVREEEQNKKGKTESPEEKRKDESFSANEISLGGSVPQLNLALWTSRSPGSSDTGDKTLTPTEKQRESSNSSTSSDQEKTLTPSQEDNSKSSKRSSRPANRKSAPTDKVSPPGRISPPSHKEKIPPLSQKTEIPLPRSVPLPSQKEKIPLAGRISPSAKEKHAVMQSHLGSGDDVPKQRVPKQEESDTPQAPEDRRRSKKVSPSSSSSTSYMSLPNKLLSAITDDLRSLLSITRRQQKPGGPSQTNPLLAHYINRLLDMSRQSVERLNVVTSEIPTPPSAIFRNASYDSSRPDASVVNADETDRPSGFVSSSTDTTKASDASASSDTSDLVNVMSQCHARISSLSQMIEQVRQENIVATPVQKRRSPSLHLDSTAYLSPPSSVKPSLQVLPRDVELVLSNNPMDESYGGVITRLISEIRHQLAKEAEKPLHISSSPPRGPTKNTTSSSSNELSTIAEQDSSSLEWSSVVISSNTGASSGDVENEFSRMGLGWAGTTLRKTKEACTLDSNSSSDFLELSALSMFGSYSHSTPIKTIEDIQSRT